MLDEICKDKLANMVNGDKAFLFPFTIESFLNFRMIRPRWRLNSCFIEYGELDYRLKNYLKDTLHYELPLYEEKELHMEYCHDAPASSYKDFLTMRPHNDRQEAFLMETKNILEDRGELIHAIKQMKQIAFRKQ